MPDSSKGFRYVQKSINTSKNTSSEGLASNDL